MATIRTTPYVLPTIPKDFARLAALKVQQTDVLLACDRLRAALLAATPNQATYLDQPGAYVDVMADQATDLLALDGIQARANTTLLALLGVR